MRAGILATLCSLLLACTNSLTPETPKGKPEADLWAICYTYDGQPILAEHREDQKHCKDPVQVRWESLPVKVHLNAGTDVDTMLRAFAAWKGWMGRDVFELTPESGNDVVEVLVGDAEDNELAREIGIAAMAPHQRRADGSIEYIIVFYNQWFANPEVAAHELGHVLGLAHDHNDNRSIMHPGGRSYLVALTPHDRRVLCSIYGGCK